MFLTFFQHGGRYSAHKQCGNEVDEVYLSSINGYECLTMEQMAPCVKIVRNVLNFWVYARWGGRGKTNMAEWSQEGGGGGGKWSNECS